MKIDKYIGCTLAALICCTACTDVELFEESNYKAEHSANVTVDYSGAAWTSAPDSMYVVASRLTNLSRTLYQVSPASLQGVVLSGDVAKEDTLETPSTGFLLRQGQYHFISFNIPEGVATNYTDVEDLDNKISSIYVGYPSYYVTSPFPTTYCGVVSYNEIDSKQYNVSFSPKKIGQDISLNFSIQKDTANFNIESIEGELSGIPSRYYLSTGYVNVSSCYRIKFTSDSFKSVLDGNATTKTYNFTLPFNALGLYVSEDQYNNREVTGNAPGVLKLTLRTVDSEGVKHTVKAIIGLYFSITKSGSIVVADDDSNYKVADVSGVSVDVTEPLYMNSTSVLDNGNIKYNTDIWENQE